VATIIVGGALANRPGNGGGAWVRLNWVLGLRQLGHTVHFVEEIDSHACPDAVGGPARFRECRNTAFFRTVREQFGLTDAATLIYGQGEHTDGLSIIALGELANAADLLVNLGGHVHNPAVLGRPRRNVYVDLDPGYTQFWHAAGIAGARLAGHDVYYTVGANVGRPECVIPTAGITWRTVRPPVVLSEWATDEVPRPWRFTTVASWRGPFGPIQYEGTTYGQKVHEFRKVIDLPRRTSQPFEVALDIGPGDGADLENLRRSGWAVVNPDVVAGDPLAFREYVRGSAAEFSPAQGVYVATRGGWFSDRTACYLAAGKPCVVQDTGADLPTGLGLLTYRTPDEAATAVRMVAEDYATNARAARALAADYLDSNRVLRCFLDELEIAT
jgi:hypothetical protein